MARNINDLNWIVFDDNGLSVSSKSEIMQDLNEIDLMSFGANFNTMDSNVQSNGTLMGTSWYTHNELIAQALASIGSAVKKIYDNSNIISATGIHLDNRVVSAGIVRKENESDAELRKRYLIAVSTPAISTKEGLVARLMNTTFTNSSNETATILEVNVVENDTAEDKPSTGANNSNTNSTISAHSILVAIRTDKPELQTSYDWRNYSIIENGITYSAIEYISRIIANYKTLGCGTSGKIEFIYTDNTMNKIIKFSFIKEKNISLTINVRYSNNILPEIVESISNQIKQSLVDYIDSFPADKDVLYNDILSVSQDVIISKGYNNNDVSISGISIKGSDSSSEVVKVDGVLSIKADEIAKTSLSNITINKITK